MITFRRRIWQVGPSFGGLSGDSRCCRTYDLTINGSVLRCGRRGCALHFPPTLFRFLYMFSALLRGSPQRHPILNVPRSVYVCPRSNRGGSSTPIVIFSVTLGRA